MATFQVDLQGSTDTVVAATDKVQFAGSGFDQPVRVSEYQDSMFVKGSGGANKSSGNTPKNNKYVSSTEVDIGAGTVNLSTLTDADAALKINFSHGVAVDLSDVKLYAYDGVDTANAPVGVTFQAAEIGDTSWTNAEGSANALAIDDSAAAAMSHDMFIATSASPESVGLKSSFKLRVELTYS